MSVADIETKPLRAIAFTSPVPGEPSTKEQYDQLVDFAASRGFDVGYHVPFAYPVAGRQMVTPTMLKHLPETIDLVLFVDHGRPIAYPVRPGTLIDAETRV